MPKRDLEKLFEVWLDDETKAMVTVFYRQNPGVVETADGLARRLGTTVEALHDAIEDHLSIGILKERRIGERVVLVYDQQGKDDLEETIARAIAQRMGQK